MIKGAETAPLQNPQVMKNMPGNRKTIRLKEYDYTKEGAYYLTICANGRQCVFGDAQNGVMVLNYAGKMVADNWARLPQRFSNIEMDEFIVMPNHMHGIIYIVGAGFPRPDDKGRPDNKGCPDDKGRGDRAPTLGQMMAYFKYGITKHINIIRETPGVRLWQRNYYEHIIRDEHDLTRIREYIINNPAQWEKDEYFCSALAPR